MILTITLNPALDWNVTVHRLVREEKNIMVRDEVVPGGKGLNVSRVLTRLGTPNKAFVVVGGLTGDRLLKLARRERIHSVPFRIRGETRTNLTLVQLRSRDQLRINHAGPRVLKEELPRLDRALRREIRKAEFVVFSGSPPPGVSTAFVLRLVRFARRLKKKTAVDVDGPLLSALARTRVWLLKPNQNEWRSIGRNASGADWVLVSKGEGGAELFGPGVHLRRKLKRVRAVCSVGAGDSMLAGFLHAFDRERDSSTALGYALAAGAASVVSPPGRLAGARLVRRFLR